MTPVTGSAQLRSVLAEIEWLAFVNILVVEDNPGDVELFREAFRTLRSSAIITSAADGYECLAILFGQVAPPKVLPDLIFLDLNLPRMSGYDVLQRIKSSDATRHIPVIVLSGSRSESEVKRAYEGHANAFVRKPSTLEDLIAAARGLKSFWMETARLSSAFATPYRPVPEGGNF